jgi:hypothetical protein
MSQLTEYPAEMTRNGHALIVHSPTEERNARVQGYDFPTTAKYAEYPKYLVHKKDRERSIIVRSIEAETQAMARGFTAPGRGDAQGFERMNAMPDSTYEPAEWPKWINGRVVESPEQAQALGLV